MSFFARDRKPPTNGYVTQLHKLWDGSVGQIKKKTHPETDASFLIHIVFSAITDYLSNISI